MTRHYPIAWWRLLAIATTTIAALLPLHAVTGRRSTMSDPDKREPGDDSPVAGGPLPDPDIDLSSEERAKLVSEPSYSGPV